MNTKISFRRFQFLFPLILLLITGLNPVFGQTQTGVLKSFSDVVYKTCDGGCEQKLDVFLPDREAGPQGYPVLMFITGGSWIEEDRTMERPYFRKKLKETLLENGFAVISVSYRVLNPETHFPSPIEDCKDAVRWIRANSKKYGFDTGNIGLLGESAGGHLAMLTAYTSEELWKGDKELADYPADVGYVADYYGPTDLNRLLRTNAGPILILMFKVFKNDVYKLRNRIIDEMTDEDFEKNKAGVIRKLDFYSPINYITGKTVPTFIAHGNKDGVVPFGQSVELKKKLDENKVENQLMEVDGADHVFVGVPDEKVDEIVEASVEFMKRHIR